MLKIGITGNIGSGKTTVAGVFELLGVKVFYADAAGKKVMTTDAVLIEGVKKAFGDQSYFNDGTLNRKYIASIVFNNENELKKLNALVHPAVFRAFDAWAKVYATEPYLVKEAAVLFESGSYQDCNDTILVAAPLETRIKRVMKRDNVSRSDVEAREAKQFSQEKKMEMASHVLFNDESQLLIPQIIQLHQHFLKLSGA